MKRYFRRSVWDRAIVEYRYRGNQLYVRLIEKGMEPRWAESGYSSIEAGVKNKQISICEARRHARTYGYTFPED